MAPKRSEVWKYFNATGNGTATCKICSKVLKTSGNTSNLMNHINNKHTLNKPNDDDVNNKAMEKSEYSEPETPESLDNNSNYSTESVSTLSSRISNDFNEVKKRRITEKQSDIVTSLSNCSSFQEGGKKHIQITEAISFMICKDMIPLSTVENVGFRHLLKVLAPLYKIPSRRQFNRMLDDKYEVLRRKMKERLNKGDSYTITTDVWTSNTTQSYLGITIHYLDNVTLKSGTLGVYPLTERHDHTYLGDTLTQALTDFEITKDQILTVVTDNGSNMVKAITETFGKSKHLPCFAHTLNLIPEKAFKSCPEVENVLNKVRSIVKWFKQSVVAADALRKAQEKNGNALKLIQDVSTRWNSKFYMLERFIELSKIVNEILLSNPKAPSMLSGAELEFIKEITEVLRPLELVTKEASGQKYTTASKVIPLVHCMEAQLNSITINNNEALQFKDLIMKDITKRFGQIEQVGNLAIATILDPRYKKLHFQNPIVVARIIENIKNLLKNKESEECHQESDASRDSVNSDSEDTERKKDLWAHHKKLADFHNKNKTTVTNTDDLIINAEISRYLNSPLHDLTEDPIRFWEKYKMVYPHLYPLARKYLQITATSVPAERLFSETGHIANDLRNRLTPDRLNKLLFLSSLELEDWSYV